MYIHLLASSSLAKARLIRHKGGGLICTYPTSDEGSGSRIMSAL